MERLKELRNAAGLTQKQMAAVLNIDRTTYVKYESGASEPTFATLTTLAEYFNVSTDYLLGRPLITDQKEIKPTAEGDGLDEALVNQLVGLSPSEVQRVLDFVSGIKASRKDGASP